MRSGTDCFARVVQEQRQVEHKRILQLFEKPAIRGQLRVLRIRERIELVDTEQRVFVCGVTMRKFVLYETGERAELGNVTTEEIHPMHHAKHAADFSFSGQNRSKNFARLFRILKSARDLSQMAAH